jgi:hypothetical protein
LTYSRPSLRHIAMEILFPDPIVESNVPFVQQEER